METGRPPERTGRWADRHDEIGVVVLAVCSNACVLYDREIVLRPVQYDTAVTKACPPGRTIVLSKFLDRRNRPDVVGAVRNGFYMPISDVRTADSVALWVTSHLRRELGPAGFFVLDAWARESCDPIVRISGEVSRAWTDAYWTYHAEVALEVEWTTGDGRRTRGSYVGKGSSGMNWAASAEIYQKVLVQALQHAVGQITADLRKTLPNHSLRSTDHRAAERQDVGRI
jgi:hypothetical protein